MTRGRPRPNPSGAAIQVAYANFASMAGFTLLGHNPAKEFFGRMAILVHDGLSVLCPPFHWGPLTDDWRDMTVGNPEGTDYVLLAGGAYIGQPFFIADEDERGSGAALGWNMRIFSRLNPYQPGGCFAGPLDHLKKQE